MGVGMTERLGFSLKLALFALLSTTLVSADAVYAAQAQQARAERPKLGLVLSGGGARGFAHIGALKALEELRVRFDVIAGTSMGSMVGGAYAAGYSAKQIEDITLAVDWPRMFAPRPDRDRMDWQGKDNDRRGLGPTEIGVTRDGLRFSGQLVPSQELDIFLQRSTEPFNSVYDLSELDIPFAAVATDLESGQRVVLQKEISLAQAMRCSMSVPGAFRPAEYKGRVLVDGGLIDNLPIDLARDMGADRVVAINVGTPLGKRDDIKGVLGVMAQVVNILTEQNVRKSKESIRPGDIYIEPDLGELTSGDFMKSRDIIEIGYKAVMDNRELFEPYIEDEYDYRFYLSARYEKTLVEGEHNISEVKVAGLEHVNPEHVLATIDIDTDKPVSNEQAAEAARDIWAEGDFQSVPFRFEPGPNGTEVLVFEPEEKTVGYSRLMFGGNVQSDFQSSNTFNVLLAHTWGWLNKWGGEWRNEIQLGEVKRFLSEFHQPLGVGGRWFLMPRVSYQWEPFDLYVGDSDTPVGEFRTETFEAGVFLGYEFPRLGRVSAGAGWYDSRIKTETFITDLKYTEDSSFVSLRANFDTLDDASFPRRGFYFDGSVTYDFNPQGSIGEPDSNTRYEIRAAIPLQFGERTTALVSGRVAAASEVGNYNMGGVFNLSGSPYGRYSGDRLAFGRVMIYHDLSRTMRELRMPIYLGGTFEIGRVWNGTITEDIGDQGTPWRKAASLYIASDTWLGPMYLVAGRTFGESSSLTFYWGRLLW